MKRRKTFKRIDKKFQREAVAEILTKLSNRNIKKVGAFINCGLGKTFIGADVAVDYLNRGKRVVISAYALKEIKENWLEEILNFGLIPEKDMQVVVAKGEVKTYSEKYPGVHFTNASTGLVEDRKVIIMIPQSIKKIKFPVDLFIIDEVHEYYQVKKKEGEGRLKTIIKDHRKSKLLGLTGTGFELVEEGDFSVKQKDVEYVIRDMPFALKQKTSIHPVSIYIEFFEFPLNSRCYDKDGNLTNTGKSAIGANMKSISGATLKGSKKVKKPKLNSVGKAVLKSKKAKRLQIEKILDKVADSNKVLVIVPQGKGIYDSVRSKIELYMRQNYGYQNCCVVKSSHKDSKSNRDAENQFRNNPNVKFMVVVDMCGTGWNFTELDDVIDLSFTKNEKLIIQRMNRACRYKSGKQPRYFFCTDQSKEYHEVPKLLTQCVNLTTKEGILDPQLARRKMLFDKKLVKQIRNMLEDEGQGSIELGDIRRYFLNDQPTIKRKGLEIIEFNQVLSSRGFYPWQEHVTDKLLGQDKRKFDETKCVKLVNHLNDVKKEIPQETDLFLKHTQQKVSELLKKKGA